MNASALGAYRVVVYGAYGHTGRFVVAELIRHGLRPILCGRDADRLEALQSEFPGLEMHVATLDDRASLGNALADAAIVVNCAGPFLDTAIPVAKAALLSGAHYIDIAAEQQAVRQSYASLDALAKQQGVVVLPGMGFFGGLGDLLATWAMGKWADADEIALGTVLSYWHPTPGTRRTGERNSCARVLVQGGALAPAPTTPQTLEWRFPEPLGLQNMVCVPFTEIITIHRHLHSHRVTHWLNKCALEDIRDPATPAPTISDAHGRSSQHFTMRADVCRGGIWRGVQVSGTDIYAVTAPLLGEAVERLLRGPKAPAGVYAPGELFDAGSFLEALSPAYITLDQQNTTFVKGSDHPGVHN